MPAVKTAIPNVHVAGVFCSHMGTISQAVMVIMPHIQQVSSIWKPASSWNVDGVPLSPNGNLVSSKRVSGSASYGIHVLLLTGVPSF